MRQPERASLGQSEQRMAEQGSHGRASANGLCSVPCRKASIVLMVLLDESGRVCWYSAVKSSPVLDLEVSGP